MKLISGLLLLLLILCCFSCSEDKKPSAVSNIKEDSISLKIDTVIKESKPEVEVVEKNLTPTKNWYVNAISGLNYRKTPKGEILGKVPLNYWLGELERTGIIEEIKDNGQVVKGEWIGVLLDKRVVYVFDGFLSENLNYSEIEIYYSYSLSRTSDDKRNTFINLSEAPYINGNKTGIYPEYSPLIPEHLLGPELINLNNSVKSKFLKRTNFSNSDKVFIYSVQTDKVYTYNVSDLKLMAMKDGYSYGEATPDEWSYQFGLVINHKADVTINQEETLVFIGKENPFQTGEFKPITWKEYTPKDSSDTGKWDYLNNGFHYVISDAHGDLMKMYASDYKLQISSTNNAGIVLQQVISSSESISPAPISEVRTGSLFKNKPPVIYGLRYHSFGCPSIFFLDKSELPIIISCDNRH